LNQVGGYVVLDDVLNTGTFTKSVSASAQTNVLQSGQAFLIETLNTGAASFVVNESSKSTTNNNLVFRPASSISSITTNLYLLNTDSSTSFIDGALAQFNAAFNSAVDWQDALKLGNINEGIGLLRSAKNLSIERRPNIITNDTLFLKLTGTTARDYQFEFVAANMQQPGMIGTLVDNYLGTSTTLNLSGTTKVNFSVISGVTASTGANRFMIVFNSIGTLPVTFTNIEAYQQNTSIVVNWKVANEFNIAQYEVERSTDGKNFTKVNIVIAKGENNSSVNYNWLDTEPFLRNDFYRIKSVGIDGSIHYSTLVNVVFKKIQTRSIIVCSNPVINGEIKLSLKNIPAGNYSCNLLNSAGQILFTSTINHISLTEETTVLPVKNVEKGIYNLQVKDKNDESTVLKIIFN